MNINAFTQAVRSLNIKENVPMSAYTTFRAGGNALFFLDATCLLDIRKAVTSAAQCNIPFHVIGNGSNLLVSDAGYFGLIIRIADNINNIFAENNFFTADAGASFTQLARHTVQNGYMGLEWAAGIPGTVGGAVAMNAGAYGGEVSSVLHSVNYFDLKTNALCSATPTPSDMGYRFSVFSAPDRIVLSATFKLAPDDGNVKLRMENCLAQRKQKQPLAYPSAGSTFKRPVGLFAGKLIEDCGLKGYSLGNACVSDLHAGFIINKGGATATEIYALIKDVQNQVYRKTGVLLEPEIKFIGDFGA